MGTYVRSATGEAKRDENYASAQVIELPKYYQSIGDPWSLIQTQFETTSGYASNSYSATIGFMGDIKAMIAELEDFNIQDINVDPPEVPGIDVTSRPNMGDLPLNENWPPNTSEKPILGPLPTIIAPNIPIFNIPDPDIDLPDRPILREVTPPGEPPAFNEVEVPGKPEYILPNVPTLPDLSIPAAPIITIPTFDTDLQDEVFSIPPGMNFTEDPFSSDIWQGLLNKIVDGIEHGGEALAPEVEEFIWERIILRDQVSEQAAYEEIENYWSSKGWEIPQGSLAGALQEKNDEIQRNRRMTSLEIGVKQAELADGNTKFILQLGKDSEVILRDFHNNQMNRKLDAEKAIAANAIEILKAQIARYNARIDKYKADAGVYGERVRAALVQVEIFKAQVEAVKVSATVQKNLVELYEKQIQAVEILVKMYVAEMQGADINSQIEARKIEIFKARVDTYVAEIGAEKAKYEVYGIAAGAEKTKVEVFSERVKAFGMQVSLVETELKVQVAELDGKAKKNDHELSRYKTELSAYAVELEAASKKVSAIVEAFRGEVSAYNADTGAEVARYGALAEEIKLRIEEARFNLEKARAEIESKTSGYVALKKLQMDGLTGVTNVSAQLAASAMNAVNASTSFGYSSGESMSTSYSYGASNSENHSFAHPTRQLS